MLSFSCLFGFLLTFVNLKTIWAIRVDVEQVSNATAPALSYPDDGRDRNANETIVGDSVLSASERNRRLIPYMAFYLPAPELSTDQKYLTLKPQKLRADYTFGNPEEPLDPPGSIPIPTAYFNMKVPAAETDGPRFLQQKQQGWKSFPSSAAGLYRSISYGGQHPVPSSSTPQVGGQRETSSVVHLMPSVASGLSAYATPPRTKYRDSMHNQQRMQHLALRPSSKSPKINFTPFTSSNKVPGDFIPIIYSPLSSVNHNDDDDDDDANNDDNVLIRSSGTAAEQQPGLNQGHNEEYILRQKTPSSLGQAPQLHHSSRFHEVQIIPTVTAPTSAGEEIARAIHPTSSPIYHVLNEPSSASSFAPSSHSQNTFKPQTSDDTTVVVHYHQRASNFHSQEPDKFFRTELTNREEYTLGAEGMTPQQQYVTFLQQRQQQQHHNKQQQYPQQHERSKQQLHDRQQFYKSQQQQNNPEQTPAHLLIRGLEALPPGPAADVADLRIGMKQQQQQKKQQAKYTHAVYPQPKYTIAPLKHQIRPQQEQEQEQEHEQQVHYLPPPPPMRSSVKQEPQGQQHQRVQVQTQHFTQHQKQKFLSSGPAPYIDYLIEEPRQSLDDEQPQQMHHFSAYNHHKQQPPLQKIPPPPAAYIVVTTATPQPLEHASRGGHSSVATPRPFYKNQAEIHLQAISQQPSIKQPTRQPSQKPAQPPSISPHYVYVTNKPPPPPSAPPLPPLGSTATTPKPKFKSSYDFGERLIKSSKRPSSLPPPPPPPRPVRVRTSPPKKLSEHYHPTLVTAPVPPPEHFQHQQNHAQTDLPDINSASLADILHKLQASNHLPQTLTPDNIDNSIKTLITILNNLKESQRIAANPPAQQQQPHPHHQVSQPDYDDYSATDSEEQADGRHNLDGPLVMMGPTKRPGPDTGRPGIDYPNYAEIPNTAFDCGQQRYKGFFGDPETNCQVWHYCDLNGGKASFLCPNGTIFSQIALTCDWWFNVKCSTTSQLYVLNERLYKYILPFNPKFPEDYSGPIVDKYLALKFQEMEEQMRLKKLQQAALNTQKSTNQTGARGDTLRNMETATNLTEAGTLSNAQSIKSEQVDEQSSERNRLLDDEVNIIQRDAVKHPSPHSTTTTITTTTEASSNRTREIELPLSLKPIVVSLTADPDYDKSSEEQQSSANENAAEYVNDSGEAKDASTPRERTKISVEQVEVIEVKPVVYRDD